ncbi:MAG: hypothetical protein V1847_01350 [Candidatus Diapherotrites archaeon]
MVFRKKGKVRPQTKKYEWVQYKNSLLSLKHVKVRNPEKYGNCFRLGDRVIEVGIESYSPVQVGRLALMVRNKFGSFRKDGIAGLYCDTASAVLARFLKEKFRATEVEAPFMARVNSWASFINEVDLHENAYKAYTQPLKRYIVKL